MGVLDCQACSPAQNNPPTHTHLPMGPQCPLHCLLNMAWAYIPSSGWLQQAKGPHRLTITITAASNHPAACAAGHHAACPWVPLLHIALSPCCIPHQCPRASVGCSSNSFEATAGAHFAVCTQLSMLHARHQHRACFSRCLGE